MQFGTYYFCIVKEQGDLEFKGRWEKESGTGELHLEVCKRIYDIKQKRLDEVTRRLSLNSGEVPKPCLLEHSRVKTTGMRRSQQEMLKGRTINS